MSHPDELSTNAKQALPNRHNLLTLFGVVASDSVATLKSRTMTQLFSHRRSPHKHIPARMYVMVQRLGVPYEVERTVCTKCDRVLDERPLKRAAA